MGRVSRRPTRAKRTAATVKINTNAKNVSPSYRYKGSVVVPGSTSVVRSHNRQHALIGSGERHTQCWVDSDGFDHPTRRDAMIHSDRKRIRAGWQPRLQRR